MHDLSDEVLCARWLENPYYQFFCGELSFCHQLPFDRSSLTHWRQRLGEEQLVALIQESLSVAHKTGALATRDLERVVVDTTVQPKAIAHPSDARLCHRALEKLVELARRNNATTCRCARPIAGWPSGRRSWSGATSTPISSSERGGNSNSCAFGWAG
jgi:IS5 family transposase